MEDYASNSHKKKKEVEASKDEVKNIEKVITGEVVTRPKPLGRRFKDVFFGGEFKGAARYIAADVLLPALRNLIVDASTKGIERVIYGESHMSQRRRPEYRGRVQYNNPINRMAVDPRSRVNLPDQPPHSPSRRQAEDVVLALREDAELVVERLGDILDKYEVVSVADLNDLLELPGTHIDNKWGWYNLSGITIRQVRGGYLIDLPPIQEI